MSFRSTLFFCLTQILARDSDRLHKDTDSGNSSHIYAGGYQASPNPMDTPDTSNFSTHLDTDTGNVVFSDTIETSTHHPTHFGTSGPTSTPSASPTDSPTSSPTTEEHGIAVGERNAVTANILYIEAIGDRPLHEVEEKVFQTIENTSRNYMKDALNGILDRYEISVTFLDGITRKVARTSGEQYKSYFQFYVRYFVKPTAAGQLTVEEGTDISRGLFEGGNEILLLQNFRKAGINVSQMSIVSMSDIENEGKNDSTEKSIGEADDQEDDGILIPILFAVAGLFFALTLVAIVWYRRHNRIAALDDMSSSSSVYSDGKDVESKHRGTFGTESHRPRVIKAKHSTSRYRSTEDPPVVSNADAETSSLRELALAQVPPSNTVITSLDRNESYDKILDDYPEFEMYATNAPPSPAWSLRSSKHERSNLEDIGGGRKR